MALLFSRLVGGGNFEYTLNDTTKVVTWTRPMRQGTTPRTRLVNVTQQLGLAIVSFTTNAAGHILTTTYTGDASTWLATDGLDMMIDDNVPGGFFATTLLAAVAFVDDTEVTWTDKVTRGERMERLKGVAIGTGGKDRIEFQCDAVGVKHHLIHSSVLNTQIWFIGDSDDLFIRDAWMTFGDGPVFDWTGNTDATDEVTFERCDFQGDGPGFGNLRLRSTGLAKKLTVNNCKFMFMGQDDAVNAVFKLDGALAHTVLVNFCTFWRCGTLFNTADAGQVMTVTSSYVFAQRSVFTATATPTYVSCMGNSVLAAGITEKTEKECGFAFHSSPLASTTFPMDPSAINAVPPAGKNLGSTVSGVPEDSRGVVRDVTTPDIGPEEDFDGFGGAPVITPGTPSIVT